MSLGTSSLWAKSSHTFFVPRQVTTNSVFELALNNYRHYHQEEGYNFPHENGYEEEIEDEDPYEKFSFSFYLTPFLQHSTRGEKLARYFLRCGNKTLTFNEINEDPNAVCSLWFGLESDLNTHYTHGTLCMKPDRQAYGTYVNSSFSKQWDKHALWFNVAFAVMHVEHRLNMSSSISEVEGPLSNFELGTIDEFSSIIDALNNPEWDFGKFSKNKLSRSGVDDVQLKLGYDRFCGDDEKNHISPYLVATIPTGKRQRSEFIFEPLVGSKHTSLGIGVNGEYDIFSSDDEEFGISWLSDFKYRYVFSSRQCRSLDLCTNGDWSRYLLVVPEDQHLATQPGINLFSGSVDVTPRGTIDFWTAFNVHWPTYNIEFGYDFWWRQKEKVCLNGSGSTSYGIFDLAGMSVVPQSASKANISQSAIGTNQAPSDASFVHLTSNDLNVNSAAHPAAYSSTFYAAWDWKKTTPETAFLLGVGGQYEFAHCTSALEQWTLWGKLGVVF